MIIRALLMLILIPIYVHAQIPQFAVVRPDGTTYICPSWDSAYNSASDGDNIYLPGVTISTPLNINKKLFIYGAGNHPDSSSATSRTSITSYVFLYENSGGGKIEGVNAPNAGIYFMYNGKKINGYTISRNRFANLNFNNGGNPPGDSLPTGVLVIENIIGSIDCYNGTARGNLFIKNLIELQLTNPGYSTIRNNTFVFSPSFNIPTLNGVVDNCIVENNIFLNNHPVTSGPCTSVYYNNLKYGADPMNSGCSGSGTGLEVGTINVPNISDIFIEFNPAFSNYPYNDNFNLKPASLGVAAGTDGTDVGIYGTSTPTPSGWVPSNPHIYFKQVSGQTNNSGQIPVQFKVRTYN